MTDTNALIAQAQKILQENDRGGYTVPTAGLYPFQWNWDAGITALGWATFDESRAWDELDSLFKGQWDNGMVPHIVFHAPSDQYFPGPEEWGVTHQPPTSAISQPPLLATMARLVYAQASDRPASRLRVSALLPKLVAYHRYFYRDRDPEKTGLVATYHPWESGMDNSPAWDEALARVPPTQRSYQRRDLSHGVDSSQRPVKKEYDRFVYQVDLFKRLKFDSLAIYEQSPFKMQDVGLNAVLLRANDDLLALCRELDYGEDLSDLESYGERARAAIGRLWSDALDCYLSHDLVSMALVPVRTSGGLMPLYAHVPTPAQAQQMAAALTGWLEAAPYGVASTHPAEPKFDAQRYWRGPTWLHINWMLALGLEHYGLAEAAGRLQQVSRDMVDQAGYWEYYDPRDGRGCGGPKFSWTAATALHWLL